MAFSPPPHKIQEAAMNTPYKKTLKQFAIYYAVAIGIMIVFSLLGKVVDKDNSLMTAIGATTSVALAGSGIWLTLSLVLATLRLEMDSRLLKRLLFFVAYVLAFLPIVFVIGAYSLFFKSGAEFALLAYLLILPVLVYLTYREIYRNFCIYRFKKIFGDDVIELSNLGTKHISQMITLHKIDPSYDVLNMSANEIARIISEIDAEKRRQAMKALGTGFSLGFKVLGFGLNVLSKGASYLGPSSTNSSASGYTPSNSAGYPSAGNNVSSSDVIESAPRPASTSPSKPLFQANSVVALSGAVVTWYQDGMMKYRNKCETCGALGLDEFYTQAPQQYSSLDTYRRCFKCGTEFRVIIKAS